VRYGGNAIAEGSLAQHHQALQVHGELEGLWALAMVVALGALGDSKTESQSPVKGQASQGGWCRAIW
jgi:hypothetical protein